MASGKEEAGSLKDQAADVEMATTSGSVSARAFLPETATMQRSHLLHCLMGSDSVHDCSTSSTSSSRDEMLVLWR